MAAQMLAQSQNATSRFMDGGNQPQMPPIASNLTTPQNRMPEPQSMMMDPMNQGLISSRGPDPPQLQTWMQNSQFNQERPMDMNQHQHQSSM